MIKTGLLIILIFFYTLISYGRNIVWMDEYSLWNDAFIGSPKKARPNMQFAIVLLKIGLFERAAEKLKFVKENNPQKKFDACMNLGGAYLLMNNWSEAAKEFKEAVSIQPDHPLAHTNLGLALLNQKLYNKAIEEFRMAIKSWPDNYSAHLNLSTALRQKGLRKEAEEEARTAEILKPTTNVQELDGFGIVMKY